VDHDEVWKAIDVQRTSLTDTLAALSDEEWTRPSRARVAPSRLRSKPFSSCSPAGWSQRRSARPPEVWAIFLALYSSRKIAQTVAKALDRGRKRL
jgi:hypothetical protein